MSVSLSEEAHAEVKPHMNLLASIRRKISLKVGSPGQSESITYIETLKKLVASSPPPVTLSLANLVKSQVAHNTEELIKLANSLTSVTEDVVTSFENLAPLNPQNTAEVINQKISSILAETEEYKEQIFSAIRKMGEIERGMEVVSPSVLMPPPPPPVAAPGTSMENKFQVFPGEPEALPPRSECSPKAFSDWWESYTVWLQGCYSKPPSDRDYLKRIRHALDKSWRDLLQEVEWDSWTLEQLRLKIQQEVLKSHPLFRRRVEFFSIPAKCPMKAGESPGQLLDRVRREAEVAGIGVATCDHCSNRLCPHCGPQAMTFEACVTTVWIASLNKFHLWLTQTADR